MIERLWIDTMENHNAYGFKTIGFVTTRDEADRICNLEKVLKSKYPWPLDHAHEFKGDSVPRFRAKEVNNIEGLTIEQLRTFQ